MRDKLGERGRSRAVGQVDTRIPSVRRKAHMSYIATAVATPLVWIVGDDYGMARTVAAARVDQPAFTDRMGIGWDIVGGGAPSDPISQAPGVFDGRDGWETGDSVPLSTSNRIIETTTNIAMGTEVTWYMVWRCFGLPNTFSLAIRQSPSGGWGMAWNGVNLLSNYGTAQVNQNFVLTQTYVTCHRGKTTTFDSYWNGVLQLTPQTPAAAIPVVTDKIVIGGLSSNVATNYSWFQFAEVIVYGTFLANAERNAVEKYLGRQYGLAIS